MPNTTLWQRLMRWFRAKPAMASAPPTRKEHHPSGREASRQRRAEQRHKLQAVAHENMIRAGVLSSAYKFKALPLDRESQSFIVLFDIDSNAMEHDRQTLADLETALQALAQEKEKIEVKSVYWRMHFDHGEPPPAQHRHQAAVQHRRDFAPTRRMDGGHNK